MNSSDIQSHLLLVGVENHFHQYVGAASKSGNPMQFSSFLREVCCTHRPDLLAEELSEEIVLQTARDSVLRALAERLGLPHLFCDPNDMERRALNIPDWIGIQRGMFDGDWERTGEYMKQFWPVREEEWLRRILETGAKRVLLVVGAAHIQTLTTRSAQLNFSSLVLHERWRA